MNRFRYRFCYRSAFVFTNRAGTNCLSFEHDFQENGNNNASLTFVTIFSLSLDGLRYASLFSAVFPCTLLLLVFPFQRKRTRLFTRLESTKWRQQRKNLDTGIERNVFFSLNCALTSTSSGDNKS